MKGIGIDIVETARFDRSTNEFARLILTDKEFEEFFNRQGSTHYLATRFAAKEAAVKAIGRPLGFRFIQITNDRNGKPLIEFLATGMNIKNAMLSISDEKDYVVAMVVLE